MKRIMVMPGVFLNASRSEKFKTGCFSVNLLRPLCRKEAAMNALFPSVLLRGTENYPDMQSLSAALELLYGAEIGGIIRKKGEVQAVGLYADFIEDAFVGGEPVFAGTLHMAAEILLHPVTEHGVFLADYVEREKENLVNAIESRLNSKRTYAVSQMLRTMCADEAYGVDRLGELEDVEPITPESLYAHYRSVLASSRIEICYLGRTEPETVAALLREELRELPREELTSVSTSFVPSAPSVRTVTEALDVTQGKLCMGFRLGCNGKDALWPAAQVMNAVYGSGVTSKLFVNVREKMSLCYYVGSTLEKYKGLMIVSSGIEFSRFETAKEAILHELDDCREGNITPEELENAKIGLVSAFRSAMDSPAQLDEYDLGQAISGWYVPIPTLIEQISAVTAEQTAAAARAVTLDTVYFLKGVET